MPFPEKVTYSTKYNLKPIIDPDGQFSAEDANHLKEKVNKNALFHDVHNDLAALQNKFPNPPKGAFAYLLDGSCYRCVNVGWTTKPEESITSQQIKIILGYTPANAADVESHEIRIGEIEGLGLFADQVNQKILIKNASGVQISELSVAFLNNEGTTFFYNEATQNLELKNDEGTVVSAIPVSAFVSNIANSIGLNGSRLSLKDTEGNELSFVTFGISNISGLQAALDGLLKTDGSRAMTAPLQLQNNGSIYSNFDTTWIKKEIEGFIGVLGIRKEKPVFQKYDPVNLWSPLYDIYHSGNLPEFAKDRTPVLITNTTQYTFTAADFKNNYLIFTGGTSIDAFLPKDITNTSGDVKFLTIGTTLNFKPKTFSATTAGSFVVGKTYTITTLGNTDFTLIGAASNTVGIEFTPTGAGTGTGTATEVSASITPTAGKLLKTKADRAEGGIRLDAANSYSVFGDLAHMAITRIRTGTELDLSSREGINYNYATPSTATTYIFIAPIVNGFARCFINVSQASLDAAGLAEPQVTGATKVGLTDYVPGVTMEMVVNSPDGTAVEYEFIMR